MDYSFIANILEKMIPAVPETLCITLIPFAVSLVLAVGITMAMYFEVPVLKDVCKVYVSFFRGTPLIGQLFLIYYGIPRLIPPLMAMSNVQAFIVTMSLHTASYVSEVLRGALLSVPKGQIEASKSIGLSSFYMMRNIVLPQAVPVAIPALVNTLIDTIKGSSIAFTIGVMDITAVAKVQAGITYQYFEAYVALVLLYWAIVLLLEFIQRRYESKIKNW
ncbi:MAG: amino acid ABC transporter permease [Candidatus Avilachnospira sp.]|jgi:putative amino-acid transport system permease protein